MSISTAFPTHDARLLIPESDVADPEVSIVIPALNEELTIAEFVAWCREGLAKAQVRGEILIVDSSKDSTAQKALAGGARVLVTPKRGLGRAYIDAIPFIRGKYVLLGDADLTYDFRETAPFVEKFRQGYDFIMGSRFKGHIEDGAMPGLHRYFGTPLTNWILNLLYSADFSDIHCGMRGITREALVAMDIQSQSWEYASEMVLKSVQMDLGRAEVPVRFLKDREGRLSHHKRAGWLSPWQAGWINLRSMLIHGAEFFAFRPGIWLLGVGLLITLALSQGPLRVGGHTFSLYWMLLGMTLSIAGLQSFYLGCLSQLFHDYTGRARARWLRVFSYNRSVLASAGLAALGLGCLAPLTREYLSYGFTLSGMPSRPEHLAILGLLLLITGFANFVFTLVLHGAVFAMKPFRGRSAR
ncbi:MAG: glycosyltransferase family 2 protein [Acidobacteriota bacterium]|nr:glycosyltransferase family 2 protein [Acidobacteriota bacterium]